jgi:predicted RNA binding protein YcfA (HicA-like mRNA interferase family)
VSQHFPVCTGKEVAAVLRKHGFVLRSQRGSHQKWVHVDGRFTIVPDHGNKPIAIGTLKSIVEASGLSVDDFR